MNSQNYPSRRHVVLFRWPLLLVLLVITVNGAFGKRGLFDWRRMNAENEKMEAQIRLAAQAKENLERQNDLLLKNPIEQERVVRAVLGYIKPNETVIEFH